MPRRTDLKSILIVGAGPIVIGQACEFDYSGVQACKALREEGYRTVLLNSNPATIMTDADVADATYIEPIAPAVLERIIEVERPDAVLPTMGGQSAINTVMALHHSGFLGRSGVELIGASAEAIEKAENRREFIKAMARIGLRSPRSGIASSLDEAYAIQAEVGFPCVVRPSFTLGGSGGGIAHNRQQFEAICQRGLSLSPTGELLIDESLIGWKEFEMEVVRDSRDNCIIVCSIENFDPMGVHTGDSITVAPALTLTDREYQILRNASIAVLREIGVDTGGSNVQFAINPQTGELVVIEMNPRVSRSSALASKATGFPIARVAAKLAVGYTLDEIENAITGGGTPCSFEPSIDYIVTKIPRFAFEKFPGADTRLSTQMKSVGEVMAIGRSFAESLQKALRSLEAGLTGLDEMTDHGGDKKRVVGELSTPGSDRLRYLADAIRLGFDRGDLHRISGIDPWFINQLSLILESEAELGAAQLDDLDQERMRECKRLGFSDARIGRLTGRTEAEVRAHRWGLGVHPVFKRIDSCAAEFETPTAYLYSCYESECEAAPEPVRKIVILGGGPNRIGQGLEFDYCCVHATQMLHRQGFQTIMINCNPETVSTDYDTSDRLYFEPVTVEDVLEICRIERPDGVLVQFGGQTPLKIAAELEREGIPIIGTPIDAIDLAEDRDRFQQLIDELGLRQPPNAAALGTEGAIEAARGLGYPLVVRPSYVLGGRGMEIIGNEPELLRYMAESGAVLEGRALLLDSYLRSAVEVDVDALCDGERVVIAGVMQHIEQAGVHSGDSACCLPAFSLSEDILEKIRIQTCALARRISVVGLMNIQFAVQDDAVYVLEVNPRASRTVPFVSKCVGVPIAQIGAMLQAGSRLSDPEIRRVLGARRRADRAGSRCRLAGPRRPGCSMSRRRCCPLSSFPGVDPILGPEMRSTGEVMGIGDSFAEAFRKAQEAGGGAAADLGDRVHQRARGRQAGGRRGRGLLCPAGV